MALIDGDEIARASLEMIQAARQEIISVEFLLRDDDYGRLKMALLREAARRGVEVIMQVDALHLLVKASLLYHLMEEGIKVRIYNEFSWSNIINIDSRDHSKLLVVDGQLMKTGDANSGNEYYNMGDGHHMLSRDIIVTGPAARKARQYGRQMFASPLVSIPKIRLGTKEEAQAQKQIYESTKKRNNAILHFLRINIDAPELLAKPAEEIVSREDVLQASKELDQALQDYQILRQQKGWGEPLKWIEGLRKLKKATFLHDPIGQKGLKPGIEQAIVNFIKNSHSILYIVSPYLILTPLIREALEELVAKKVKIKIYTNSITSSDNKMTQIAYERRVQEIASLGDIEIYEYNGPETWHAKILIRDEEHIIITGYNIDWRSEILNMETGVYTKNKKLVKEVLQQLANDSNRFTLVAHHGRLTMKKLIQKNQRSDSLVKYIVNVLLEPRL